MSKRPRQSGKRFSDSASYGYKVSKYERNADIDADYEAEIEGDFNPVQRTGSDVFVVPSSSSSSSSSSNQGGGVELDEGLGFGGDRDEEDDSVNQEMSLVGAASSPGLRPTYRAVRLLTSLAASPEEVKHRDFAPAARQANIAGEVILMNSMPQTVLVTGRIGRKVRILSFQLRGSIRPHATETSWHRSDLYVIWDNQPGAALPVNTDFLEDATSVGMTNWNNRSRFTTLVHRYWMFDPMSVVAQSSYCGRTTAPLEIYKKVNRIMLFKTDNSGVNTVADISYGAMYYFVVGDSDVNYSTFTISMRLLFDE